MNAGAVTAIDWTAPWLWQWRFMGQAASQWLTSGRSQSQALNQAATTQPAVPVRFVPQNELPTGVAYEQHIFDTGCVPTREGLHDFFNGLAWLLFPLTKQRLNQLHGHPAGARPGA